MTITEACTLVLQENGGKAPLRYIYFRVKELVVFTGKTPDASIRTELQNHPKLFRAVPEQKGWWELKSPQEQSDTEDKTRASQKERVQADLEALKASVAERDAIIAQQQAEIAELQSRETVEQYVKRQNSAVINTYKYKTDTIDAFRNIYDKMGLTDACQELDHFINEQKQPYPFVQAHDYLGAGSTKQVTNIENYYGPKPDDQQKH